MLADSRAGTHLKSCHLGTHSTSICDVTNTVLGTEEAKGNEAGERALLALMEFTAWVGGVCASKQAVTARLAQGRHLTQLGEGWWVESGGGQQQAKS